MDCGNVSKINRLLLKLVLVMVSYHSHRNPTKDKVQRQRESYMLAEKESKTEELSLFGGRASLWPHSELTGADKDHPPRQDNCFTQLFVLTVKLIRKHTHRDLRTGRARWFDR